MPEVETRDQRLTRVRPPSSASLRTRFLTIPNTSCKIRRPASLRSEGCSDLSRNAVRTHPGTALGFVGMPTPPPALLFWLSHRIHGEPGDGVRPASTEPPSESCAENGDRTTPPETLGVFKTALCQGTEFLVH